MNIAIIGAGFAGLSTAKVLRTVGFDVTVYEKAPDVGGVWSVTRRYPGLRTQNNKGTYAMSDFPMPQHYPEWPTGEQVQAYLADYARHFDLERGILLCSYHHHRVHDPAFRSTLTAQRRIELTRINRRT